MKNNNEKKNLSPSLCISLQPSLSHQTPNPYAHPFSNVRFIRIYCEPYHASLKETTESRLGGREVAGGVSALRCPFIREERLPGLTVSSEYTDHKGCHMSHFTQRACVCAQTPLSRRESSLPVCRSHNDIRLLFNWTGRSHKKKDIFLISYYLISSGLSLVSHCNWFSSAKCSQFTRFYRL